MPWNFPYYQVARFAGPNLCIGNTILLKHAPQCPESAAAMQQIFDDAGFPAGAYVNIYATNDQAAAIIADPRVAAVSLTGSERAGAAVAEVAGRNLKKVVLELGGSDPFIVLSTDDLDATVKAAIDARFDNTGQSCNAAKRFIVAEDLYEPFVERFTEATLQRAEGIAPLSSLAAAERLEAQVQKAVDGGANLTGGGERKGAFYPPGVLTGVTPDNAAFREEFFGPISMIFKVSDEGRGDRGWPTTPRSVWVPMCSPPIPIRPSGSPTPSKPAWCSSTASCSTAPSCRSVASSAPGFGREMGRFGMDEFVNKKLIRSVMPLKV